MQRAPNRNLERPRIHRIPVLEEQRHLERASPRQRQRRQDVLEDILDEIAQTHVAEVALGLGRSRRECPHALLARVLAARHPEGRFPDTRHTLEQECSVHVVHFVDEGVDAGAKAPITSLAVPRDASGRGSRQRRAGCSCRNHVSTLCDTPHQAGSQGFWNVQPLVGIAWGITSRIPPNAARHGRTRQRNRPPVSTPVRAGLCRNDYHGPNGNKLGPTECQSSPPWSARCDRCPQYHRTRS
jgi:hypothetical protein